MSWTDLADGRCPTCGTVTDPVAHLGAMNRARDAFEKATPRVHCPACRKRCSPSGDSVNASDWPRPVEMVCRHCEHRWEIAAESPQGAETP